MSAPPRIDPARIAHAAHAIAPVFRDTPTWHSPAIDAACGALVSCKLELLTPIRSFKGRGADWFVASLDPGDTRPLACASAGNFGQGLAWAARARGRALTVYAATTANTLKIERMRALGATVVQHGDDLDAAKTEAKRVAAARGWHFVEDGLAPAISEGAGTIAVELLATVMALDVIVAPVGNGALVAGIGAWCAAHAPYVRVIGVCAAGAPAMAESWRRHRAGVPLAEAIVSHPRVDTIADGIAIREPIAEAVADMRDVVHDVVTVSDEAIRDAMRVVWRAGGVVVEASGAAGLAALLDAAHPWRGLRVATVLCGGNCTDAQVAEVQLQG
ncbi:MAG: pyridoxal-phosphate dependent enzyme [Gemmatimonadaceae bacterium]|nr:pyridoxal-phosphate dependent enzyme [Gemmatimonadaceae bacterium]